MTTRAFLLLTCFFLALSISSCSTGPKAIESKNDSPSDNVILRAANPTLFLKNGSTDDPDRFFSYYCRDGKQIRAIKNNITAVIGKPPSGIPLDQAQNIQSHKKRILRFYAASFFRVGGETESLFTWENKIKRSRFSESTGEGVDSGGVRQFVIENKTQSEYINDKLNERVDCDAYNPWIDPNGLKSGKNWGGTSRGSDNNCYGLTLVSLVPGSFVLSLTGENAVVRKDGNYYLAKDRYSSGPMRDAPLRTGLSDDQPLNVKVGSKNIQMHPIFDITLAEPYIISQYFTMLIPDKVQSKFFGNQSKYSPEYSPEFFRFENKYFLNRDGTYNLTDATKFSAHMWDDFFDLATTVKEAPGKTSDEINFEVSLDLNLFCKYGRPIDSLLSN